MIEMSKKFRYGLSQARSYGRALTRSNRNPNYNSYATINLTIMSSKHELNSNNLSLDSCLGVYNFH